MNKEDPQAQLELATYTPTKLDAEFSLPARRFSEAEEKKGQHGKATRVFNAVLHLTQFCLPLPLCSPVLRKIDLCLLPVLAFTYGLQFLE